MAQYNVSGTAFAPDSGAKYLASLLLFEDGSIDLECPEIQYSSCFDKVQIDDALGSVPRDVRFSNGWRFSPDSNNELNDWSELRSRSNLLHRFERSVPFIAVALLITILTITVFIRYGLPSISHSIANKIPAEIHIRVGENALKTMDSFLLKESELEQADQQRVHAIFKSLQPANITTMNGEPRLLLRKLGTPNAFAMAGGLVVISDDMVALADNDEEIAAVLLHELGHQHHNHVMSRVVQSTLVGIVAAYILGDASGYEELLAATAIAGVTLEYSRRDETQADEFAAYHLQQLYGEADAFVSIFEKLDDSDINSVDWLKSHPSGKNRIAHILNWLKQSPAAP